MWAAAATNRRVRFGYSLDLRLQVLVGVDVEVEFWLTMFFCGWEREELELKTGRQCHAWSLGFMYILVDMLGHGAVLLEQFTDGLIIDRETSWIR